jgi:hypothetical protein
MGFHLPESRLLEKFTFLIFKLPLTVPTPWADDLKAYLINVYETKLHTHLLVLFLCHFVDVAVG